MCLSVLRVTIEKAHNIMESGDVIKDVIITVGLHLRFMSNNVFEKKNNPQT